MNNVVLTPYNEDINNEGYPIGQPTVKELIAILSQLPEDYRVTCCGAENYLYLFEDAKCITIEFLSSILTRVVKSKSPFTYCA